MEVLFAGHLRRGMDMTIVFQRPCVVQSWRVLRRGERVQRDSALRGETQVQPAATEMFARDVLQPLARNLVQIVPVTRFHSQSAEARTASQVVTTEVVVRGTFQVASLVLRGVVVEPALTLRHGRPMKVPSQNAPTADVLPPEAQIEHARSLVPRLEAIKLPIPGEESAVEDAEKLVPASSVSARPDASDAVRRAARAAFAAAIAQCSQSAAGEALVRACERARAVAVVLARDARLRARGGDPSSWPAPYLFPQSKHAESEGAGEDGSLEGGPTPEAAEAAVRACCRGLETLVSHVDAGEAKAGGVTVPPADAAALARSAAELAASCAEDPRWAAAAVASPLLALLCAAANSGVASDCARQAAVLALARLALHADAAPALLAVLPQTREPRAPLLPRGSGGRRLSTAYQVMVALLTARAPSPIEATLLQRAVARLNLHVTLAHLRLALRREAGLSAAPAAAEQGTAAVGDRVAAVIAPTAAPQGRSARDALAALAFLLLAELQGAGLDTALGATSREGTDVAGEGATSLALALPRVLHCSSSLAATLAAHALPALLAAALCPPTARAARAAFAARFSASRAVLLPLLLATGGPRLLACDRAGAAALAGALRVCARVERGGEEDELAPTGPRHWMRYPSAVGPLSLAALVRRVVAAEHAAAALEVAVAHNRTGDLLSAASALSRLCASRRGAFAASSALLLPGRLAPLVARTADSEPVAAIVLAVLRDGQHPLAPRAVCEHAEALRSTLGGAGAATPRLGAAQRTLYLFARAAIAVRAFRLAARGEESAEHEPLEVAWEEALRENGTLQLSAIEAGLSGEGKGEEEQEEEDEEEDDDNDEGNEKEDEEGDEDAAARKRKRRKKRRRRALHKETRFLERTPRAFGGRAALRVCLRACDRFARSARTAHWRLRACESAAARMTGLMDVLAALTWAPEAARVAQREGANRSIARAMHAAVCALSPASREDMHNATGALTVGFLRDDAVYRRAEEVAVAYCRPERQVMNPDADGDGVPRRMGGKEGEESSEEEEEFGDDVDEEEDDDEDSGVEAGSGSVKREGGADQDGDDDDDDGNDGRLLARATSPAEQHARIALLRVVARAAEALCNVFSAQRAAGARYVHVESALRVGLHAYTVVHTMSSTGVAGLGEDARWALPHPLNGAARQGSNPRPGPWPLDGACCDAAAQLSLMVAACVEPLAGCGADAAHPSHPAVGEVEGGEAGRVAAAGTLAAEHEADAAAVRAAEDDKGANQAYWTPRPVPYLLRFQRQRPRHTLSMMHLLASLLPTLPPGPGLDPLLATWSKSRAPIRGQPAWVDRSMALCQRAFAFGAAPDLERLSRTEGQHQREGGDGDGADPAASDSGDSAPGDAEAVLAAAEEAIAAIGPDSRGGADATRSTASRAAAALNLFSPLPAPGMAASARSLVADARLLSAFGLFAASAASRGMACPGNAVGALETPACSARRTAARLCAVPAEAAVTRALASTAGVAARVPDAASLPSLDEAPGPPDAAAMCAVTSGGAFDPALASWPALVQRALRTASPGAAATLVPLACRAAEASPLLAVVTAQALVRGLATVLARVLHGYDPVTAPHAASTAPARNGAAAATTPPDAEPRADGPGAKRSDELERGVAASLASAGAARAAGREEEVDAEDEEGFALQPQAGAAEEHAAATALRALHTVCAFAAASPMCRAALADAGGAQVASWFLDTTPHTWRAPAPGTTGSSSSGQAVKVLRPLQALEPSLREDEVGAEAALSVPALQLLRLLLHSCASGAVAMTAAAAKGHWEEAAAAAEEQELEEAQQLAAQEAKAVEAAASTQGSAADDVRALRARLGQRQVAARALAARTRTEARVVARVVDFGVSSTALAVLPSLGDADSAGTVARVQRAPRNRPAPGRPQQAGAAVPALLRALTKAPRAPIEVPLFALEALCAVLEPGAPGGQALADVWHAHTKAAEQASSGRVTRERLLAPPSTVAALRACAQGVAAAAERVRAEVSGNPSHQGVRGAALVVRAALLWSRLVKLCTLCTASGADDFRQALKRSIGSVTGGVGAPEGAAASLAASLRSIAACLPRPRTQPKPEGAMKEEEEEEEEGENNEEASVATEVAEAAHLALVVASRDLEHAVRAVEGADTAGRCALEEPGRSPPSIADLARLQHTALRCFAPLLAAYDAAAARRKEEAGVAAGQQRAGPTHAKFAPFSVTAQGTEQEGGQRVGVEVSLPLLASWSALCGGEVHAAPGPLAGAWRVLGLSARMLRAARGLEAPEGTTAAAEGEEALVLHALRGDAALKGAGVEGERAAAAQASMARALAWLGERFVPLAPRLWCANAGSLGTRRHARAREGGAQAASVLVASHAVGGAYPPLGVAGSKGTSIAARPWLRSVVRGPVHTSLYSQLARTAQHMDWRTGLTAVTAPGAAPVGVLRSQRLAELKEAQRVEEDTRRAPPCADYPDGFHAEATKRRAAEALTGPGRKRARHSPAPTGSTGNGASASGGGAGGGGAGGRDWFRERPHTGSRAPSKHVDEFESEAPLAGSPGRGKSADAADDNAVEAMEREAAAEEAEAAPAELNDMGAPVYSIPAVGASQQTQAPQQQQQHSQERHYHRQQHHQQQQPMGRAHGSASGRDWQREPSRERYGAQSRHSPRRGADPRADPRAHSGHRPGAVPSQAPHWAGSQPQGRGGYPQPQPSPYGHAAQGPPPQAVSAVPGMPAPDVLIRLAHATRMPLLEQLARNPAQLRTTVQQKPEMLTLVQTLQQKHGIY